MKRTIFLSHGDVWAIGLIPGLFLTGAFGAIVSGVAGACGYQLLTGTEIGIMAVGAIIFPFIIGEMLIS